jgi:hypothetical protein
MIIGGTCSLQSTVDLVLPCWEGECGTSSGVDVLKVYYRRWQVDNLSDKFKLLDVGSYRCAR